MLLSLVIGCLGGYALGKSANPNNQLVPLHRGGHGLGGGGYTSVTHSVALPSTILPSAIVSPSSTLLLATPTATQQNNTPKTEADIVTQDYYNWYFTCINDNSKADVKTQHSPREACPFNAPGVLTTDLLSKLQPIEGDLVGADPVLCAQNIPQKITFEKAVVPTNGTATVVVHTIWGTSAPDNITVGLRVINNQWKINTINCNFTQQ